MAYRLTGIMLAGLVATPATDLFAQSNPWYFPPSQPVTQYVPQVYGQAPQNGLGAGYTVQPNTPATVLAPGTGTAPAGAARQGMVQQPPITGSVTPGNGAFAPAAPQYIAPSGTVYGAPAQGNVTAYVPQTYYVPQTQPQAVPQYLAAPQYQVVPQYQAVPQIAGGQSYQQQPALGSYPPLGGDPTLPPVQPNAQQPVQQQAAQPAAAVAGQFHPGFAGPSTLSPSYGGLTPFAPSTLGGTPYLGLPFY